MDSQNALERAMRICSQNERCKNDIRLKLIQWDVPGEKHDDLIQKLVDDQFIDERRYSKLFIRSKINQNKWGKNKIRWQLIRKKIPEQLINEGLDEVNDEQYYDMIAGEIKTKMKQISPAIDPFKKKSKILQFAASRGYEMNIVNEIIGEMIIP